MSAAVDICAEYPDELAAMRSEQDAIDAEEHARAERVAEGVALLRTSIMIHEHRRTIVDAAVSGLCRAIDAITDAREAYERAGETLLEAMYLVARLRGGDA